MSKFTEEALTILDARYLKRDNNGVVIETPDDMIDRVINTIANAEHLDDIKVWSAEFHRLLDTLNFLPNSPTLMNAGRDLGQLSACFVLPIEDDISAIFEAVKQSAIIHKCLWEEQLIETQKGFLKAKDVIIGDKIRYRGNWVEVRDKYNTGIKNCYKLSIKDKGLDIIVGEDHPILTYRVRGRHQLAIFRKVKNIKNKNYRVGVCFENKEGYDSLPKSFIKEGNYKTDIIIPEKVTKELMFLLGMWFGDGSKDKERVRFTNSNEKLIKLFIDSLIKVFGVKRDNISFSPHENSNEVCIWSVLLTSYFDYIGFSKEKKDIPKWIYDLPSEYRWAFIEGIFNTDGGVKNTGHVTLTNKSKIIVSEFKILLNTLGVYGYIQEEKLGSHLYLYFGSIPYFAKHLIYNTDKKNKLNIRKREYKVKIFDNIIFLPFELQRVGDLNTVDFSVSGNNEYEVSHIISHNSGGGTGFSFSRLRPKNSIVKSTNGVASGPISFMKCFDTVTEVIKQGGTRRGANLGVLVDSHPDIYDWVGCKRDKKSFSNFNISVALSDDFMDAVRKDGKYPLIDPSKKRGKIEEISARKLFDYICDCAWYSGEPGIIFIDTINKSNPTPWLGKIESTNPCVVGDTLILTNQGYARIKDIKGMIVHIWNGEEWSAVEIRETGQDQEILDIDFSDGSNLSCTPYHKFYLNDGTCKEAKDLQIGDKLEKYKFPVIEGSQSVDEKLAYTAGFYSGDGSVSEGIHSIYVYGEKQQLLDKMLYKSSAVCEGDRTVITLDSENYKWNKEFVPNAQWNIKTRMIWLSGLIDSDGGVNSKEGSIVITSVNKSFLMNVKKMLNTVGVNPTVSVMREEGYQFMPDGRGGKKEYYCETAFRLIIPASAINGLIEKGLKTYRVKLSESTHKMSSRYIYVSKITKSDKLADKVYCFTEPKRHRGIFNGVIAGNCGEQPLLPWESCNLGSINISNFVNKKDIDYIQLGKTIETSVRFLDDVIDVNRYPKIRIARKTKLTRKIGLGIMGWADALLLMGIKYDSAEAFIKAEEVMSFIQKKSHEVSKQIAKEKGIFPAARKLKSRNATTTTLAPTGTISMIAGCSSGIEPIFSKSYTKTALDGKVLDLSSKFADSPALVTAHEISAENHIKMQAAFQKHTDNAVSKTINLPENATVEDVKNAVLLAYDLKCKGFTVYREGTREAPLQITTEATNGVKKDIEVRECNSGRCSL